MCSGIWVSDAQKALRGEDRIQKLELAFIKRTCRLPRLDVPTSFASGTFPLEV